MKWYPVRMNFGSETYQDEIKGCSPANALENAIYNWPEATNIKLI